MNFTHAGRLAVLRPKMTGDISVVATHCASDLGVEHITDCRALWASIWDANRAVAEAYVLGYRFDADVLVISVGNAKIGEEIDQSLVRTLCEALLVGATTYLEVEPGEIGAFVQDAGARGEIILI